MLFDLEDYGTTMRVMTDQLRSMNPFYVFDLGLDFTQDSHVVGFKIPKVDEILTINEKIKASNNSWNGFGGPEGATINLGDGAFSDFHTTAMATRDAFISGMKKYIFGENPYSQDGIVHGDWKISKSVEEIESKFNAADEFFDAYVTLGENWNNFWSCMFSFGYYDKGYVEGDVIPDATIFYEVGGQYIYTPVKFKILTQEIYDAYYAALQTLMQKAKTVLVLGGMEA